MFDVTKKNGFINVLTVLLTTIDKEGVCFMVNKFCSFKLNAFFCSLAIFFKGNKNKLLLAKKYIRKAFSCARNKQAINKDMRFNYVHNKTTWCCSVAKDKTIFQTTIDTTKLQLLQNNRRIFRLRCFRVEKLKI